MSEPGRTVTGALCRLELSMIVPVRDEARFAVLPAFVQYPRAQLTADQVEKTKGTG